MTHDQFCFANGEAKGCPQCQGIWMAQRIERERTLLEFRPEFEKARDIASKLETLLGLIAR